ncbi:MAG TPA: hypothetical protein VGO93_29190, partial [Candidatus Xenobia bacterium]
MTPYLLVFWLLVAGYLPTLGQYDPLGCRLIAAAWGCLFALHLPAVRKGLLLPLLAVTGLTLLTGWPPLRQGVVLVGVWALYA